MRILLAVLVVAAALAGCTKDDGHTALDPVTCPDGTTLDPETVEGHHDAGFDALAACPVPPSIRLEGVPATLEAYRSATFSWTLDNGSQAAHSLLTSVRVSPTSVADAELADPDSYGAELVRHEHQNLPVTYEGTLQFSQAATLYLRAYATINGADYWTPEAILEITPVQPTGVSVELTHSPGGPLGDFGPTDAVLNLGDAVVLVNDDLVEHAFTFTGPGAPGPVTVGAVARSDPIPFLAPGTYKVDTDDVQPKTLEFTVVVPA